MLRSLKTCGILRILYNFLPLAVCVKELWLFTSLGFARSSCCQLPLVIRDFFIRGMSSNVGERSRVSLLSSSSGLFPDKKILFFIVGATLEKGGRGLGNFFRGPSVFNRWMPNWTRGGDCNRVNPWTKWRSARKRRQLCGKEQQGEQSRRCAQSHEKTLILSQRIKLMA